MFPAIGYVSLKVPFEIEILGGLVKVLIPS